jgi:hypothetical protein
MDKILESRMNKFIEDNISYGKSKYGRWIEAAKEACPNMSVIQESNLIRCYRNMEENMISQFGADEVQKLFTESTVTKPSNINSFIKYGFDIITSALPANPIEEFASIQAIDKRVGEIFYMDVKIGNTKGSYTAGDNYMAALTGPATGQDYSNEKIDVESVGTGDGSTLVFSDTLAWSPIKTGTDDQGNDFNAVLNFTVGSTAVTVTGVSSGGTTTFTNATYLSSATLTESDGTVAITFAGGYAPDSASDIYMTYYYDSARQDVSQSPEAYLSLTSTYVSAVRRFMNTRWMIDSAIMLNKEHGRGMEESLVDMVLAGVMNEIAVEAAAKIRSNAGANSSATETFTSTVPATSVPYIVHRQEVLGTISKMATQIESEVRKVTANFVIAGKDLVNVIKGLPRDMYDPVKYADKTPTGMHVIGVLDNQYKIIQNFDYTASHFVVGAKGPDWLTTGYVYAPFIPLMTTPVNWNLAGDQWRSLLTWSGQAMVNSKFFHKGTVA